jgi:hypothetical protein
MLLCRVSTPQRPMRRSDQGPSVFGTAATALEASMLLVAEQR